MCSCHPRRSCSCMLRALVLDPLIVLVRCSCGLGAPPLLRSSWVPLLMAAVAPTEGLVVVVQQIWQCGHEERATAGRGSMGAQII
ncbi:hypothetical protein BDZ89DRAFT_310822 [Hymenopellis radicata]|nr:hypothetical protein BDZ89DRAFT_310822 [Hymenopellis radicata]